MKKRTLFPILLTCLSLTACSTQQTTTQTNKEYFKQNEKNLALYGDFMSKAYDFGQIQGENQFQNCYGGNFKKGSLKYCRENIAPFHSKITYSINGQEITMDYDAKTGRIISSPDLTSFEKLLTN